MTQVQWLERWPDPLGQHQDNPFCRASFLGALESTGVCSPQTGWAPHHLIIGRGDDQVALPCYEKTHSWGEYVFDWAWAHAYEQHRLPYYPKLVCAIPYTPSPGPRASAPLAPAQATEAAGLMREEARAQHYSGCHLLFPDDTTAALWTDSEWMERQDVQFHWYNRDYRDFDDFLERFSSRKRKNVRKERRSVADQGLTLTCYEAAEISTNLLRQFYIFYHATYLKRGRHGYLNLPFFQRLLATQADSLVLFMAYQGSEAVAGALCFRDSDTLYGRYWGCVEEYNHLHFETCYYQGIDYCIRKGLQRFDPGTQGEHKLARGFEPRLTRSFHWLAHPEFHQAAQRFCQQEAEMVAQYRQQMLAALPFKHSE